MKSKKPLFVAGGLFAAVAAGVALWLLWYAPPLRPSSDYSVSYSIAGQTHTDAQLFRPVGVSSRYYISIPSPSERHYRWFVIDFARSVAALPLFGVICPCGTPCVHRDQPLGIVLTDPKTDDHWQVSVTRESVHLFNGTMSVNLARNR